MVVKMKMKRYARVHYCLPSCKGQDTEDDPEGIEDDE